MGGIPPSGMILQNHKRLPVIITYQWQNHRFRVFEAGYWKDFQNLSVTSKKQAKTLGLIL
jgi:hypothetical protein